MMTHTFELFGSSFAVSDAIGIVGVVMVLWAYLWIQIDRLSQDALLFSGVNFIGSVLIIVSLMHTWNLASFIIEIAWLAISFFGILKCCSRKLRGKLRK
jgi:hypothetical protein